MNGNVFGDTSGMQNPIFKMNAFPQENMNYFGDITGKQNPILKIKDSQKENINGLDDTTGIKNPIFKMIDFQPKNMLDFDGKTGMQNPQLKMKASSQENMIDFPDDTIGMRNPLFKIKDSLVPNPNDFKNQINIEKSFNPINFPKMADDITEKEIQSYKNKLNNLISKLINTHDVDEEISIHNETKKELNNLFYILNIKKKEIYSNNNIINDINKKSNNYFNPMFNPNFTNINSMQQKIIQQQMMQQQMIQQQIAIHNLLNNPKNNVINVIFRKLDEIGETHSLMIQCYSNEKVASIIDRYRNISGDRDSRKKFIFNDEKLNPNLTMAEAGIDNNANIFVDTQISIIIRENGHDSFNRLPTKVQCYFFEKITSIIEKYRENSGDHEQIINIIFNDKTLPLNLTVKDSGITNNSNIFIIKK